MSINDLFSLNCHLHELIAVDKAQQSRSDLVGTTHSGSRPSDPIKCIATFLYGCSVL